MVSFGREASPQLMKFGVIQFLRARAAYFTAQYLLFDFIASLFPGAISPKKRRDPALLKELIRQIDVLLSEDAELFSGGVLPINHLLEGSVQKHLGRIPKLIRDGIQVYRRRGQFKHKDFEGKVKSKAEKAPEYYQRNFHFQTDGYFSKDSAEIYDHQVEMLFSGTADAMRRSWIKKILELQRAKDLRPEGKNLKILEVACGSGAATRILVDLYPKAKITATDLSSEYVAFAKERISARGSRVSFKTANAEKLLFKDGEFDLVVCVFLFHELPLGARKNVISEMGRVLKPGGLFVAVDSIQLGDSKIFDPLLADFPKNYHEPFYKNYVATPLGPLFESASLKLIEAAPAFASKYWIAEKRISN